MFVPLSVNIPKFPKQMCCIRKEMDISKLKREKELLKHELEMKAELYQSELNLMREMLAGMCVRACL